jgi:hypothetical protein
MAEQPDGPPEHHDPDHAKPNETKPDATGPQDAAASTAEDENPRGLLFISDVQALRRADTVRVHAADGIGVIDASLTTLAGDQPRIYSATEQRLFPDPDGQTRRRRIEVAADIAGFDTTRRWHDHQLPDATATAVFDCVQLHEVWRSVAAFLRVGDIVRLRWHAGTGTDTDRLTAVGLHRDELFIEVRRGKRMWTFLLDVAVGPSNRRMVAAPAHR